MVARSREPAWTRLSDEDLLELPLRALHVRVEDSRMAPRLAQLHRELARRGIAFRPHTWFSSEWFTPDGVPGFAVPFYLSHPRLVRLERAQLLTVEGGSSVACMRLMRHETGHALDNAYRLTRREACRAVFGKPSAPYRGGYVANPDDERYVRNLPMWYAQSHPVEDFAETFAVWLDPESDWRRRHPRGATRAKLDVVDGLMRTVCAERPHVRCREQTESLAGLRHTLGRHYATHVARRRGEPTPPFEAELRRAFEPGARAWTPQSRAARWIERNEATLAASARRRTGVSRETAREVLALMALRCRELGLRPRSDGERVDLSLFASAIARTVKALRHGDWMLHR